MSDTLLFAQFKNYDLGKEIQIYLIRDLFGQLSLVHFYGGKRKIKLFDDLNTAWREVQRSSKAKLKSNYKIIEWNSSSMPVPEFVASEMA